VRHVTHSRGQNWDVFISYASEDLRHASLLSERLAQRGWRCFVSGRDLDAHVGSSDWTEAVDRVLDDAPILVLLVTPAALESRWVEYEWRSVHSDIVARQVGLLIPVCLRGEGPATLPRALRRYQCVDARDSEELGATFERIAELVRVSMTARTAAASPVLALTSETGGVVAPRHTPVQPSYETLPGFPKAGADVIAALQRKLGCASPGERARAMFELGRAYRDCLQAVFALKCFQDAYKEDPSLVAALVEARSVYRTLGKPEMVEKLLRLELRGKVEASYKGKLLVELGNVLIDRSDFDGASAAYSAAVEVSNGREVVAVEALADMSIIGADVDNRYGSLKRMGFQAVGELASRLLLRAARIARRVASNELENLLQAAYQRDPNNEEVAMLYESMLVAADRTDMILELQQDLISAAEGAQKTLLASRFAYRWINRHQNETTAVSLLKFADVPPPLISGFAREIEQAKRLAHSTGVT